MDNHVRKFIQRAKNIAPLLSGRDDVRVTIGGSVAYSAGGHINLPMGDFTDPDWVAMTRGWIDHECGHEKHTDHACFAQAARKSIALKNILNSLEDARMEREVGSEFPGAKSNLSRLVNLAIEKDLFMDPDEAQPISSFILYHARRFVVGQAMLDDYADRAEKLCRQSLGDEIVDKIKALIESSAKARNTKRVYEISCEIFELLQDEMDENEDDEEESDNSSGDSEGDSDSSEKSGDEEGQAEGGSESDGEKSEGDSDDNASNAQSGNGDDESEDFDTSSSNDSHDGDQDDSDVSSSQGSANLTPNAQQKSFALDGFMGEEEFDFHQKLAEVLEEESEEYNDSDKSNGAGSYEGYEMDIRRTCDHFKSRLGAENEETLISSFYKTLHRSLSDRTRTLPVTRKRGSSLLTNKLAGIPAGNANIFSNAVPKTEIVSDVTILVDASGSMGDFQMKSVNRTAFSLSKALGRMKIDSQVAYFGCFDKVQGINHIYLAKDFKESLVKSRFALEGWGGTPTHNAMMYAMSSLMIRKSNNKLMFILTDGDPISVSEVKRMNELARKMGIKVIPIGLGVDNVKGFDPDSFITAADSDAVNTALQQAIKMRLFA